MRSSAPSRKRKPQETSPQELHHAPSYLRKNIIGQQNNANLFHSNMQSDISELLLKNITYLESRLKDRELLIQQLEHSATNQAILFDKLLGDLIAISGKNLQLDAVVKDLNQEIVSLKTEISCQREEHKSKIQENDRLHNKICILEKTLTEKFTLINSYVQSIQNNLAQPQQHQAPVARVIQQPNPIEPKPSAFGNYRFFIPEAKRLCVGNNRSYNDIAPSNSTS
jgi:prefoldin subunit 5